VELLIYLLFRHLSDERWYSECERTPIFILAVFSLFAYVSGCLSRAKRIFDVDFYTVTFVLDRVSCDWIRDVAKAVRPRCSSTPLEKKYLERSKEVNDYSQDQRFCPLAGPSLRKFLTTLLDWICLFLLLEYYHFD
jgi:hypothetical protein